MRLSQYMIILGIDPGSNLLGYSVISVRGGEMRLVDLGTLKIQKVKEQAEKLKIIYHTIQDLIEKHQPDEFAIETPIYGKNPQSMLKLGRAQGVAIVAAITIGIPVTEYNPKTIKRAVTGNGNASKEQMSALLQRMLSFTMDARELDASDALSVAVCHHLQRTSPLAGLSSKKSWDQFIKDNPNRISG